MITLKTLQWSNAFSYGSDNTIDFADNKVIQLLGANGNGKSSIALILEEVLYNKNSKGIKKGDILNRYSTSRSYSISLDFIKNDIDNYRIETKRGSTQQVKLFKNGEDISSHTATGTYKLIEEIIGINHKTFCQIVCQSHASSLEFLTSADTARKKFLIELLNLSKYTKIGELFKELSLNVNKELISAQSKVDTITEWINKYLDTDFTKLEISAVPSVNNEWIVQANELQSKLENIVESNKKITKNNTYIQCKNNIVLVPIPERPKENLSEAIAAKANFDKSVQDAIALKNKMSNLGGHICPTCLQDIDQEKRQSIINEQIGIIDVNKKQSEEQDTLIKSINDRTKLWGSIKDRHTEYERLHQLIDINLGSELLNEEELKFNLNHVKSQIQALNVRISEIEQRNKIASTHNDKLDLISSQIVEMKQELLTWNEKLVDISSQLFKLNTLAKTFSTTGLVAYKIENLAKELEDISNEYLGELSDGRFQISFQITGSDKLNVIITDHGMDIQIEALSAGETTRVNVAVLLAIRKLMQSISDSRINLLFLDETISTLDTNGKEKLVEVLLQEDNLNTVLVSHEFTHPLLEKLFVTRTKEVSKLIKE